MSRDPPSPPRELTLLRVPCGDSVAHRMRRVLATLGVDLHLPERRALRHGGVQDYGRSRFGQISKLRAGAADLTALTAIWETVLSWYELELVDDVPSAGAQDKATLSALAVFVQMLELREWDEVESVWRLSGGLGLATLVAEDIWPTAAGDTPPF